MKANRNIQRFRIAALAAISVVAICAALMPGAAMGRAQTIGARSGKHFAHVLIIVLENQNFDSARKDPYLAQLAQRGAFFTNFKALFHPSYPNYLAMIAGTSFGVQGDRQVDFPDDDEHKTIGNFLDWRSYAENYPESPKPFLGDDGKYARKHVPFLSFSKVQKNDAGRIVPVDIHDPNNRFLSDIAAFRSDPEKHPLPQYMFYTPNLDDDGHDPGLEPAAGLKKASRWLNGFLGKWFPPDGMLKGTLVVVTFDESEGREKTNHIYTVFLGDMVKPGVMDKPYTHYSVLKTVEDNFDLPSMQEGDRNAEPITGIWK